MITPRQHATGYGVPALFVALQLWFAAMPQQARATVVWSDAVPRVIHKTPIGSDIIGGAVARDDKANDVLYFKFHVNPLSDAATEEYYAVFQLFESDKPRLAVGNAPEAWGYSAYYTSETGPSNAVSGEFNLRSSQPEGGALGEVKPYEVVQINKERTIVFKVQYLPGGDDLVTVWLNPVLTSGATEENQPAELVTRFKANATFNRICLRHDGGGNGWIFSDMAVGTSFSDFVVVRFWQTWWFRGGMAFAVLAVVIVSVRVVERRKFQIRLRLAEQERALERERARIAQDLHDDLGSSLARISLLCGLARGDAENTAQLETHMIKLTEAADETVRSLEEIVWAVRPGSDTLQSLVEYITHFANELFEGGGVRCRLDMPEIVPPCSLPPEMRHNIFLVVKESLTNVLKHSGADEVHVQVQIPGEMLEITVHDNGRGIRREREAGSSGQGLGNMERRAAAVGGKILFDSTSGKGTTVKLFVKLPIEQPRHK